MQHDFDNIIDRLEELEAKAAAMAVEQAKLLMKLAEAEAAIKATKQELDLAKKQIEQRKGGSSSR